MKNSNLAMSLPQGGKTKKLGFGRLFEEMINSDLSRPSQLKVVKKIQKKIEKKGHSCDKDLLEKIKLNIEDVKRVIAQAGVETQKKIYLIYVDMILKDIKEDHLWKELSTEEKKEIRAIAFEIINKK